MLPVQADAGSKCTPQIRRSFAFEDSLSIRIPHIILRAKQRSYLQGVFNTAFEGKTAESDGKPNVYEGKTDAKRRQQKATPFPRCVFTVFPTIGLFLVGTLALS